MAPERCPRCSARRLEGSDVCARCLWRFTTVSQRTLAREPVVIEGTGTSRCPSCSRYTGPDAKFCPHCGIDLARPVPARQATSVPRVEVSIAREPRSGTHRMLRLLLTIWLIAYPVVACTPILIGAANPNAGGGWAILGGWLAGSLLFGPWIAGIIVLGLLVLLTA